MSLVIPANLRNLRPPLTRADNFVQFWEQTLQQLHDQDSDIEIINSSKSDDGVCLQDVAFRSFGGAIIHAYLLTPKFIENGPLIVYTHGYMGRCEVVWKWARQGASVLGIDVRGFGYSRNALPMPSPYGYVLTGIESEATSVLRGAICDFIRGAHVANELLQNRQQSTVYYGRSFGGALAAISAALTRDADLLVSAVPTFGWAEGRRKLVQQGSGAEINAYLEKFPQNEAQVMHVLSYFDTMNFAPLIKSDSFIGVGLKDLVVPAETVYAFINHLTCHKQIRHFPVSHTALPEEGLWDYFENEWFRNVISQYKQSFSVQLAKANAGIS